MAAVGGIDAQDQIRFPHECATLMRVGFPPPPNLGKTLEESVHRVS
jgi:hypothetical protein